MKKTFYKYFVLMLLLIVFLLITVRSYTDSVSSNLKDNFFRLHILANSDSSEDQDLKLKVRDAILEYMNAFSKDICSKEDSLSFVRNHLNTLQEITESVILKEGYTYPVQLETGTFYFPTKAYANISLPAGFYDGLKIKIGQADGQNWWCSLFPPLCFVDVSSGIIEDADMENLENSLNKEDFAIITNDSRSIKLKFKLVELFSK